MLPMKAVRLELGTLLAADATTLAPAVNGNKVALIAAAFTPNENLTVGGLTLATFTGSTPVQGSTGAQQVGVDPITGQQMVTVKEPLGGWRWACTVAPASTETIYGFALLDSTLATLLGVQLFPSPIPVSAVGDEINAGTVKMAMVLQPMS